MAYSDVFFVRSDLLPEKFKGMDIKDTYDIFPLYLFRNVTNNNFTFFEWNENIVSMFDVNLIKFNITYCIVVLYSRVNDMHKNFI